MWVKGEKQLSVVFIKVIKSTEGSNVHDEE